MRLLIADSDPELAETYDAFFSRQGYDVEIVDGADQCLALTRERAPDVLILDYELAWGGGDRVLAHLRDAGPSKDIGVLVITGELTAEELSHELTPPVLGCLTKPFGFHELLEMVRSVTPKRLPENAGELPQTKVHPF